MAAVEIETFSAAVIVCALLTRAFGQTGFVINLINRSCFCVFDVTVQFVHVAASSHI